jgi:hypothetical protein
LPESVQQLKYQVATPSSPEDANSEPPEYHPQAAEAHPSAAFCPVILINVVTFFVYGIDKWNARHNRWRIPEAVLLGWAFWKM